MPLHDEDEERNNTTNGCNGHELNNCLCLEDEYAGTSSSVDTSCTLEFSDESSCKINDNDKKETSKKSKRTGKGRRSTRCRSPTQVIFTQLTYFHIFIVTLSFDLSSLGWVYLRIFLVFGVGNRYSMQYAYNTLPSNSCLLILSHLSSPHYYTIRNPYCIRCVFVLFFTPPACNISN